MSSFAVVLPAAGRSERFGTGDKKTFAKLDGRPVFLKTIEQFVNRDDVCGILLVVGDKDLEQVKSSFGANLAFMNVTLVEGGPRRCDSVAQALKRLPDDAEYIAIHDAVRPCVSQSMIDAVFAEAVKTGAAILAAPVIGTLKRVAETGVIEETVDRAGLFEAQTPQVFRRDLLEQAYAKLADIEGEVTDDAQLLERLGEAVTIVEADATNLKITTKADLTLAGAILRSRPQKPVRRLGAFEEAQW